TDRTNREDINGSAVFAKRARGANCREPRTGASSNYLSDCDCRWPSVAFCLADPIRFWLGNAVRRADRGCYRLAFHLVYQNIPLSGHAGARESTHYRVVSGKSICTSSWLKYLGAQRARVVGIVSNASRSSLRFLLVARRMCWPCVLRP